MNRNIFSFAIFAALIGLGPVVSHADESSESKVKIEDVKPDASVRTGEDVDAIITNKKMRAESGSKSRYSIASQLYYYGGSIEKPLAEERPNIGAAYGTTDVAQLTGQISAKYNVDTTHSIMAGVGVRYITPLQGTSLPDKTIYDGDKIDADNPYLLGQYVYKAKGVQNVLTLMPRVYTNSNLVGTQHYLADVTMAQTSVYEIGTSGVSFGLYGLVQGISYSQNTGDQNDFSFGLDPFVEYQLTDKVNLRTVFNLWNYDHIRAQNWATYSHENLLQSLGVGIAVTRDIFLYPNLQFVLDDIRADRTNVALNTAINLF